MGTWWWVFLHVRSKENNLNNWVLWLILFFFLLLDLFFTVIRVSFNNARLPQMLGVPEHEEKSAQRTLKLLEKPELRATLRVMLGITHGLFLATSIWIGLELYRISFNLAGLIGFAAGIYLVLALLEFSVERLPLRGPEEWALKLTPITSALNTILRPITGILTGLQGTHGQPERSLGSVTEDELKTWVEVGQPEGGLEKDERRMIYSIFQFGDTLCREIMVPRIDVLALDVNTPLAAAVNEFVESGHSRLPVYEENIDNVIGLLYAKDLLKIHTTAGEKIPVRKLLRPAYFVPESKKVDDLLAEMQAQGVHLAVVVDEYGGMAGIVTLEDIVEEIVGEIRDEYDQGEEVFVQQLSNDEYLFSGRVSLDDFNDALGTELVTDNADTLGGYIYGELGRVPNEGDQLQVENWKLTVEEVRGRRISRIRCVRGSNTAQEETNDSEPGTAPTVD